MKNNSLKIRFRLVIFFFVAMQMGNVVGQSVTVDSTKRYKNINIHQPVKIDEKKLNQGNEVKNIILLDLFRVGQKIGGIPPQYLEILNNFSGDIFVGGGIKNIEDILNFKNHNFSGILIATALYDGTITAEKLWNLK